MKAGERNVHCIVRQFVPLCVQNVKCKSVVSVLGSKVIETVKGSRGRGSDLPASRLDYDDRGRLVIPIPVCIQSSKTWIMRPPTDCRFAFFP